MVHLGDGLAGPIPTPSPRCARPCSPRATSSSHRLPASERTRPTGSGPRHSPRRDAAVQARAGSGISPSASSLDRAGAATSRYSTGTWQWEGGFARRRTTGMCPPARDLRGDAGFRGGLPDDAQHGGTGSTRPVPRRALRACQGRAPRGAGRTSERARFRAEQRAAVLRVLEAYSPEAMVVFDVDLGHTDPQWVVPYGGAITIDGPARTITAHYRSGPVD